MFAFTEITISCPEWSLTLNTFCSILSTPIATIMARQAFNFIVQNNWECLVIWTYASLVKNCEVGWACLAGICIKTSQANWRATSAEYLINLIEARKTCTSFLWSISCCAIKTFAAWTTRRAFFTTWKTFYTLSLIRIEAIEAGTSWWRCSCI